MAKSDSQELRHQKMATRRQRWLAPFISAEVRWDCGNGYQEKVFENGQPVKSGKELHLP